METPSEPPVLPEDVWFHIFSFLAPPAIAAVAAVSNDLRAVATRDVVWDAVSSAWGVPRTVPARPRGALPHFRNNVWPQRVVPLRGVTSVYNQNYACSVEAVVFEASVVRVRFTTRGDYSLGELQRARDSHLFICPSSSLRAAVHSSVFIPSSDVDDVNGSTDAPSLAPFGQHPGAPLRHQVIRGELVFDFAEPIMRHPCRAEWFAPASTTQLWFRYGDSGYSHACVAVLSEEFLRKHRLEHFSWVAALHEPPASAPMPVDEE